METVQPIVLASDEGLPLSIRLLSNAPLGVAEDQHRRTVPGTAGDPETEHARGDPPTDAAEVLAKDARLPEADHAGDDQLWASGSR